MKINKNAVFCSIIFLTTLFVYILTLARSVSFTDSGELAAVASTLGVAHPTGYPLFTILGYLWTLLPFPLSQIVKLNVLSAILIAASNVFFFHTFKMIALYLLSKRMPSQVLPPPKISNRKDNKKPQPAQLIVKNEIDASTANSIDYLSLALALSLGFAQTVWQEAVTVEVYALHYFMINIALFFALKAFIFEKPKLYLISSFLIGLSFTNHLTTLLILPGVLFLYFSRPDSGFKLSSERAKQFLILLIPFVIGLSVYLYLPLRAGMDPLFNWGDVSRGFDKFLYHVSGKQYQVWMFTGSKAWAENFVKFFSGFPYVFSILFLLPFAFSFSQISRTREKFKAIIVSLFAPVAYPFTFFTKNNKTLLWFLVIVVLSGVFYSFNYSIHDIDSYFYSAYWALFILFGLSIALNIRFYKPPYILLILPIFLLFTNYNNCDLSDDYSVEEYTRIMVGNLPQNSIIISAQWDYWCSAFWYLQKVEGLRPDVVLIEKELMRRTWYPLQFSKWNPTIAQESKTEFADYMADLEKFESGSDYNTMSIQSNFVAVFNSIIENNFGKRPLFMTLDVMQSEPDIAKDYMKVPHGFAFELRKSFDTIPIDLEKINIDKLYRSTLNKDGHLYDGIRQATAVNLVNIAKYGFVSGRPEKAQKALEMAKKIDPTSPDVNTIMRELSN